ncbi:MAG: C_GCAxxG_C_C family protein [Lentisphaeria bacterium]|nr:C_GCAxxG_C_C family protein [Lentisphaeria bacterium]
MSKSETAREFFMQGANCAQAVFGAFAKECGLTVEQALVISSGFGGGVGRMREVCGAVSGMVLVLDMLYGSGDLNDKGAKDAQYARVQELANAFKAECGSIVCRELLGLDKKAPTPSESEARTPEYYKKRPCAEMVALAAELLEKYIEKRKAEI